jgi:hypothetical protein
MDQREHAPLVQSRYKWSSDLFGCFDSVPNCTPPSAVLCIRRLLLASVHIAGLCATCCPWYRFGQSAGRAGIGNAFLLGGVMLLLLVVRDEGWRWRAGLVKYELQHPSDEAGFFRTVECVPPGHQWMYIALKSAQSTSAKHATADSKLALSNPDFNEAIRCDRMGVFVGDLIAGIALVLIICLACYVRGSIRARYLIDVRTFVR